MPVRDEADALLGARAQQDGAGGGVESAPVWPPSMENCQLPLPLSWLVTANAQDRPVSTSWIGRDQEDTRLRSFRSDPRDARKVVAAVRTGASLTLFTVMCDVTVSKL